MIENPLLSVVVPCFNEEKNVSPLLQRFASVFIDPKGVELILVDNGSRDGTGAAIDKELATQRYPFARKVTVAANRGYGFGIMAGLREARGNVLAWTHADLQTNPADILRARDAYAAATSNPVLVKGHRKNRLFFEKVISLGMQGVAALVLGMWLTEINAQPKLFPRRLYERLGSPPDGFGLDLYLLYVAKRNGFRFVSIPVELKDRIHGEAKGGGGHLKVKLRLIRETVWHMVQLRFSHAQD